MASLQLQLAPSADAMAAAKWRPAGQLPVQSLAGHSASLAAAAAAAALPYHLDAPDPVSDGSSYPPFPFSTFASLLSLSSFWDPTYTAAAPRCLHITANRRWKNVLFHFRNGRKYESMFSKKQTLH